MAHPPAFQFYVKDWLTSETVLRMDDRDQGIYIRLLAASWTSSEPGTLPLPLSLGAKVVGFAPAKVHAFLKRNPSTFHEVDGRLVNDKLRAQWLELKELSQKRAELGRRGGLAKARILLEQNSSPALASALAKSNTNPAQPRREHSAEQIRQIEAKQNRRTRESEFQLEAQIGAAPISGGVRAEYLQRVREREKSRGA